MDKKVKKAQSFLKKIQADGWLLYDFQKRNRLAHLFLEIAPQTVATRRFFYWIPQNGAPIRLVHAIEPYILDAWPGEKRTFLSWQSLQKEVKTILFGAKRIAMEYSPMNENPYISYVDGGIVDLVRSFEVEVISSGEFLPHFTSVLNAIQGESHIRSTKMLSKIAYDTWNWIRERLLQNQAITEYQVQQKILTEFQQFGLTADAPPIVGVNAHSADPHYEPTAKSSSSIYPGDFILIDLWAKEKKKGSIFGDITQVGVAAQHPSVRQTQIFNIVRSAQKMGIAFIKQRFAEGKIILGYEVDNVIRDVIQRAGFGDFFIHRSGHSIDTRLHGSGAHLDNLEIHEGRPLLPATCFSIEPGIYLPGEFGVRLESNIYIHQDGQVEVTGGEQEEIHPILRKS